MRLLLVLMLIAFSGQIAVASVARSAPAERHTALIFANAYGDTVWFAADTIATVLADVEPGVPCPPRVIVGEPALPAPPPAAPDQGPPPRYFYIVPRTSSVGLVLLVISKATEPRLSVNALIERLASDGLRRHIASVFWDRSRDPAILEPGCFDDRSMRWPCGWTLQHEVEPLQPIRMTFVVVGRPVGGPEARRGSDGAPVPISDAGRLRPYDLSSAEVSATARVVGDLIVDFDRRALAPLKAKGTTVRTDAAYPW